MVFESHITESVKKISTLVAKFDYQVCNIRIVKKMKIRNSIVRRVMKLIKGEAAELVFSSIDDKRDSQFTNYACIAKAVIA